MPVAKHGNRAATSRSGSADVLEALGVPLDVPAAGQAAVLRDAGIAFLFAQTHHPAMKHAMPIRRELGIRTLFNSLGPLANPAGATHQLLGAYDDAVRRVLAEALRDLGSKQAWVVRSSLQQPVVLTCAWQCNGFEFARQATAARSWSPTSLPQPISWTSPSLHADSLNAWLW